MNRTVNPEYQATPSFNLPHLAQRRLCQLILPGKIKVMAANYDIKKLKT